MNLVSDASRNYRIIEEHAADARMQLVVASTARAVRSVSVCNAD
jgi:hypothetical protein